MESTPRIRWIFRVLTAALGAAQVAVSWNDITPDGISYLDLARAYLRHDWAMTINAYWGPAYSWLLAGVFGVFKPSLRWEFPLAHMTQFFLLLVCVLSFEYFWSRLLASDESGTYPARLPDSAMWLLGYSLFVWLITGELTALVNPDLLLTTEILLMAGLLVTLIQSAEIGGGPWVGFGLLLGIGYLTKAVMFPLAFVFVAVGWLAHRGRNRFNPAIALVFFLAVALPWVGLLSHSKGRLTFSDTGKLNFAWFNYGLPYVHWQGEPADSGFALHPTRKIFERPLVFEFNGPLRATYPPWYDPSYWNEGLSPRFQAWPVAKHAAHGLVQAGYRLVMPVAWIVGMAFVLLGCDLTASVRGGLKYWPWLMVSLAALGLYALTLVVSRYTAPWQLLFWGGVLCGLRGNRLRSTGYRWMAAGVAALLVGGAALQVYQWPSAFGARDNARPDYAIAEGLRSMGLHPGDKVAIIGYGYQAYWAYLDHFGVVAEIRAEDGCEFWQAEPATQEEILRRFASAGANAVVANAGGGVKVEGADLGCVHPGAGWRRIDNSRDYVHFLQ